MSNLDNSLHVRSGACRLWLAKWYKKRYTAYRYLALAVLESSGLSGWLLTRGKCCNEKLLQSLSTSNELCYWVAVTTLETFTVPSLLLTACWSLSSSSTHGAGSAHVVRVAVTALQRVQLQQ